MKKRKKQNDQKKKHELEPNERFLMDNKYFTKQISDRNRLRFNPDKIRENSTKNPGKAIKRNRRFLRKDRKQETVR